MNVFIVGAYSPFTTAMIDRLNKNGHRVFMLVGKKNTREKHKHVFEQYEFEYNSDSAKYILESARPDVVLFCGAWDNNFTWTDPKQDAMDFSSGLINMLMSCSMLDIRNFIYLSSQDVYCASYAAPIGENVPTSPRTFKGISIAQGEDICRNYAETTAVNPLILRIDHMVCEPEQREDISDFCEQLCLNAMLTAELPVNPKNGLSCIAASDVVEAVYLMMTTQERKFDLYNISSSQIMSELDVAEQIRTTSGNKVSVIEKPSDESLSVVLSNERIMSEFPFKVRKDNEAVIAELFTYMQSMESVLISKEDVQNTDNTAPNIKKRRALRFAVPFLENILCAVIITFLSIIVGDSSFLGRIDLFLLYVLLFAGMFGRQQGILSAFLGVIGFAYTQLSTGNGHAMITDSGMYFWIAELFIIGMAVGYIRDRLMTISNDKDDEINYLNNQLSDILDINNSNMRIKTAYQNQLLTQSDSIGRVYSVVNQLESLDKHEVLFKAARVLSDFTDCPDVAIYSVEGSRYARLISSTSDLAKCLGVSFDCSILPEFTKAMEDRRVYVNRSLLNKYPSMASILFDDDKPEFIIMLWNLPFERMTLQQSNMLSVASSLIYNAVHRANIYMEMLKNEQFYSDTNVMTTEAFTELKTITQVAADEGLTSYSLIGLDLPANNPALVSEKLGKLIRKTDNVGLDEEGKAWILLSNTDHAGAEIVSRKLQAAGIPCTISGD